MGRFKDSRFTRNFIALVIAWIVMSLVFGCIAWALFAIFTYAVPGLKLSGSVMPFIVIGMVTSWKLIEVADIDINED